jgi:RHS repeat-associated protein
VTYQYDELGRLSRAETAANEWGQAYVYDGFGNLLQQNVTKGSAPSMNLVVDGWTNRVAGQGYDAAGNMTHAPGSPSQTLGWDAESRMTVAWGVGGIWNYTYSAGNERVEALGPADGSRRVYFYDVTGELLGEYSVLVDGPGKLYPKQERLRVPFAGRPLEWEDRLGSKVVGPIDQQTGQATRYRYYPYGQNIGTNVGWDDVQFATYTRDGATGLDYARNRYYTRTWGRFLSPDPYVASGGPADPGSWNRYAYVQGDPVNWTDEAGLFRHCPRGDGCRVDTDPFYDSQNGGAETRIVGHESNTGRGGGGTAPPAVPGWVPYAVADLMKPQLCGVNPITNTPGFANVSSGVTGELRPGKGGDGRFGSSRAPARTHQGIDISGLPGETNVYAAVGGTVLSAGEIRGYGLTVTVQAENGFIFYYAHLSSASAEVGSRIDVGTVIGVVGQSGNASGQPASEAHLHFAIWNGTRFVDPVRFLNSPCPWSKP